MNKPKLMVLDRYGWPIERIKGRPIRNLLRLLIHGRRIARWPTQTAGSGASPVVQQPPAAQQGGQDGRDD